MFTDRRTLKSVNGLFTGIVLTGVAGVGWLTLRDRALSQVPDLPPKMRILRDLRDQARAQEDRNSPQEAERLYLKAIEHSPNNEDARWNLARFYDRQGQDEKAYTAYLAFVPQNLEQERLPTGDRRTLIRFGDLAKAHGDKKSARQAYLRTMWCQSGKLRTDGDEFAHQSLPRYSQKPLDTIQSFAYVAYAQSYWSGLSSIKNNDKPTAELEKSLHKAIALAPREPVPYMALATYFRRTGQPEAALEASTKAERLANPKDFATLYEIAGLADTLQQKEIAHRLTEKATAAFAYGDPQVACELASLNARNGNQEQARQTILRTIRRQKFASPDTNLTLAGSLVDLGDKADAKAFLLANLPSVNVENTATLSEASKLTATLGLTAQSKIYAARLQQLSPAIAQFRAPSSPTN